MNKIFSLSFLAIFSIWFAMPGSSLAIANNTTSLGDGSGNELNEHNKPTLDRDEVNLRESGLKDLVLLKKRLTVYQNTYIKR
ncbi:hypothetical protein [Mechercharimyces sp. CAU 1602]|uniref:hypothetical protein n=1 Tax=Mechercharimyces sp. CAU 1602 TaxID=2973933 RepID=UPI0021638307|nr:hypothetical protein [Mechercharimyces sp. CAU 1602]MCS1350059.1 hypothetical protein [Mechercharimyces sp. CAU 1602]